MRRRAGTVVLVLGLLLMACSSDDGEGSGDTSSPAPTGGGAGTTIVAEGFAFNPDSVDVNAGEVTLTVENKDSAEHTFTLDDGSSDTDLPAGETVTITLDLTTTVGWHCTIHPSMTGTLNVVA